MAYKHVERFLEAELDGMNRVNVTPSTSMVLKKELLKKSCY